MVVTLQHYLAVAAILFTIGVFGIFVNRKYVIIIQMSVELILLAVNINFVAFSSYLNEVSGQIMAMFVLTVAAAEAASPASFHPSKAITSTRRPRSSTPLLPFVRRSPRYARATSRGAGGGPRGRSLTPARLRWCGDALSSRRSPVGHGRHPRRHRAVLDRR